MKLIVGLGNPGDEYINTRHNVGFQTIDKICKKLDIKLTDTKFNGVFYKNKDFILAKPMTYMNNSGLFVEQIRNWYNIEISDIFIICDDLDTEIGQAKIKTKGSSGGHNGMNSVIKHIGTDEINRLKIGIGKPIKGDISKYVLEKFSNNEKEIIDLVIDKAAQATINVIYNGVRIVVNNFNKKTKKSKKNEKISSC